MSDIFLSHVQEDFPVVRELADGLEGDGYSTWYYERDSNLPGVPHPLQTRKAIEEANAFLLLISPQSLAQPQHVRREVMRAVNVDKPFIPLLLDVSYPDFAEREPAWEDALAGAVATPMPSEGPSAMVPVIGSALQQLGIAPETPGAPSTQSRPVTSSTVIPASFGDERESDVFLSHVGADSDLALRLADSLEAHGFITWYHGRDDDFLGLASSMAGNDVREAPSAESEAAASRLVNHLFTQGIKDNASEIHIDPSEQNLHVSFRLDGLLREVIRPPKDVHTAVLTRVKQLLDIDPDLPPPQRNGIEVSIAGVDIELNGFTLPTPYGEKAIIRILDPRAPLQNVPRVQGFVALVSPASVRSKRFMAEVHAAFSSQIPVVPFLLGITPEQLRWTIPLADTVAPVAAAGTISSGIIDQALAALQRLGIEPSVGVTRPRSPSVTVSLVVPRTTSGTSAADVFVSHGQSDSFVATSLVDALEGARYTAWCYGRDALLDTPQGDANSTKRNSAEQVVGESPVVEMANNILKQAVVEGASEIHMDPAERDLQIQFNVGGMLREMMRAPRAVQSALLSRIKILSHMDIAEKRRPQMSRFGFSVGGKTFDLHAFTLPTPFGEKVVIQILDPRIALDCIGNARSVIAVVSQHAMDDDQLNAHIEAARSSGKPVLSVLSEVDQRQQLPETLARVETAISVPPEGLSTEHVRSLVDALSDLGIGPTGLRLEVALGDITEQRVDAIVNAANSTLLGGGGVDGAIHSRGGPEILQECKKLRDNEYPQGLPVGRTVATTAGRLPARWVVHAAGPQYSETEDRSHLLASCYTEALHNADRLGATSVAFPAISTGAFGYPVEQAARIAIRAIKEVDTKVEMVRFVLFDRATYDEFEQALLGGGL